MTNQKQRKVVYSMDDDNVLQQNSHDLSEQAMNKNLLDISIDDDRSTKKKRYLVDTSIISVNSKDNRYDNNNEDNNKSPILSNVEKALRTT